MFSFNTFHSVLGDLYSQFISNMNLFELQTVRGDMKEAHLHSLLIGGVIYRQVYVFKCVYL